MAADTNGILERIADCNNAPAWDGTRLRGYLPLRIRGRTLGHVRDARASLLVGKHERLRVRAEAIDLLVTSPDDVSDVLASVCEALVGDGHAPAPRGEFYPVVTTFGEQPYGRIDRAYVPFFGLRAFGVHVNGFVRGRDGELSMWLGQRAADRSNWPGHLDQLAAGGQPFGAALRDNAVKELGEEAGVDSDLAAGLRSVGAISYVQEHEVGVKPDTMFCFDLELPADFEPQCSDGEVERFDLHPIDDVVRLVRDTRRFKPNCALVVVDFLVRHGLLDADAADYARIVHGLRRPAPW